MIAEVTARADQITALPLDFPLQLLMPDRSSHGDKAFDSARQQIPHLVQVLLRIIYKSIEIRGIAVPVETGHQFDHKFRHMFLRTHVLHRRHDRHRHGLLPAHQAVAVIPPVPQLPRSLPHFRTGLLRTVIPGAVLQDLRHCRHGNSALLRNIFQRTWTAHLLIPLISFILRYVIIPYI